MRQKLMVLTLMLGMLAMPALAQFDGPSAGGRNATVAQAANSLRIGTYVTLTGNIVEHLREDYFTFKDASGSIRVEVPANVFRGQRVVPATIVRITGEVDRGSVGRYIYVKSLDIVTPK